MSRKIKVHASCPYCGFRQAVSIYTSINVTLEPQLRKKVFDNALNRFTCRDCRKTSLVGINVIYHDMNKKFAVWFNPGENIPEVDMAALMKVSKSMGIGEYLFKAPKTSSWEEFKKTIRELEEKS